MAFYNFRDRQNRIVSLWTAILRLSISQLMLSVYIWMPEPFDQRLTVLVVVENSSFDMNSVTRHHTFFRLPPIWSCDHGYTLHYMIYMVSHLRWWSRISLIEKNWIESIELKQYLVILQWKAKMMQILKFRTWIWIGDLWSLEGGGGKPLARRLSKAASLWPGGFPKQQAFMSLAPSHPHLYPLTSQNRGTSSSQRHVSLSLYGTLQHFSAKAWSLWGTRTHL